MKKKEFDLLKTLLSQWRRERRLTKEIQRAGFFGNLLEELCEYERATNDNERIDSLCDMLVFTINTFDVEFDTALSDTLLTEFSNIIHILPALHDFLTSDQNEWAVIRFIASLLGNIRALGYDDYQCMLETLKEISSRTGSYNEDMKKWVKDTSDEAKKHWYKANYDKCKVAR